MYAEPSGFDRGLLADRLEQHWRIAASSLEYQPVGFGTHHYLAVDRSGTRWWINVDDLTMKGWLGATVSDAFIELERCLATAVALRGLGLDFVHAPMASDDALLIRMPGSYAVSVYSYIEGRSSEHGAHAVEDERLRVLDAMTRMHEVGGRLTTSAPQRDPLAVPWRSSFATALSTLDTGWNTGPYGDATRALLRNRVDHVHGLFERYDRLASGVRAGEHDWTVTHGEPHAANVIWTSPETFVLIDWDTVAVGPPERDLWMLNPRPEDVDGSAIELFERWWALSEITGYTDLFRRPHDDDENTRLAWASLGEYLADP